MDIIFLVSPTCRRTQRSSNKFLHKYLPGPIHWEHKKMYWQAGHLSHAAGA